MFRRTMFVLLALLLVVGGFSTALARDVTIEDVLVADDVRVVAINSNAAITNGGSCWSTNSLSPDYWNGGWPVTTNFYPGDMLAYCTAAYRVPKENPGPHNISLHVDQFATVRGLYQQLVNATMDTTYSIYNEAGYEYTDWALAVYMYIPGILRIMRESHQVDWDMVVTGYGSATGQGSIMVHPGATPSSQKTGRSLAAPAAKPLASMALTWAQLKR